MKKQRCGDPVHSPPFPCRTAVRMDCHPRITQSCNHGHRHRHDHRLTRHHEYTRSVLAATLRKDEIEEPERVANDEETSSRDERQRTLRQKDRDGVSCKESRATHTIDKTLL